MQEMLTMTSREIDKLKAIKQVIEGAFSWAEAAEQLRLSQRQIARLCVVVKQEGNKGVIHGLRGKPSNHQLKDGVMAKAIELVNKDYMDFGPTFANEKIRKRGVHISINTLRKGMIKAGIWKGKKRKARHRQWRERRTCVGMLVQLDGSLHDWFEGRGRWCTLIIFIDDATSKIMYGEFVDSEDTYHLMRTTREYLKRYGRVVAYYVDMDTIYKVNRQPTVDEQLRDVQPITQFTRAMNQLGIEVISAATPQAKGRVERGFRTHQDRLVKEMRLRGISTIQQANRYLQDEYIPQHNSQFAVEPVNTTDAHRPLLRSHDLDAILSIQTPRMVFNDFTVRYKARFLQLAKEQPVRVYPKAQVLVQERLDGSLHLLYKGRYLKHEAVAKPAGPPPRVVKIPAKKVIKHALAKPNPFRRFDLSTPAAMMAAIKYRQERAS